MIELLLHEYRAALTERTAIDSVGRLIGVALAVFGLSVRELELTQVVGLCAVALTSAAVWQIRTRSLTRQVYGLEELLGRLTGSETQHEYVEDAYVMSRRLSEVRPGWRRLTLFEPLIWLNLNLAVVAVAI